MNLKFKSISIFDSKGKLKRKIDFTDTYFIIGDVSVKKGKGTSNALGKTTLVSIISYILSGNMNKEISDLKNYLVSMEILYNSEAFQVSRKIGSTLININGKEKTLDETKIIFDINRCFLTHIIHLAERDNIINDSPNKYELYKEAYKILDLDVIDETSEIYSLLQERNKTTGRLEYLHEQLEKEDLYDVRDSIKQKQAELLKIQNLDEIEILKQTQKFHNERDKSIEYKKILMSKKAQNNNRIDEIDKYVKNINVSDDDIIKFYDKIDKELSSFIHLKVDDVIKFHKDQSVERSKFLIDEKKELLDENIKITENIKDIELTLPKLKKLIDENNELKHLFEIQNSLINDISQLTLKNTYFDELSVLESKLEDIKLRKLEVWNQLRKRQIDDVKEKYRHYSKELVTKIFPESYQSYFDIKVVESNVLANVAYPINFLFGVSKDNSEGVRNARNAIVDLIMFNFSDKIRFMIWDSSAFNGIDPNQLKEVVKEIIEVAKSKNKQAIVFFNKFQLGEYYEEIIKLLNSEDMLILSDKNTLLNEDF